MVEEVVEPKERPGKSPSFIHVVERWRGHGKREGLYRELDDKRELIFGEAPNGANRAMENLDEDGRFSKSYGKYDSLSARIISEADPILRKAMKFHEVDSVEDLRNVKLLTIQEYDDEGQGPLYGISSNTVKKEFGGEVLEKALGGERVTVEGEGYSADISYP